MVFVYLASQIGVFWLSYTATIFWGVQYPFHAQRFKEAGKNKYLHITIIMLALLFPLLPVIMPMIAFAMDLQKPIFTAMNITFISGGLGYQVTRFPPILCTPWNSGAFFYSLALPLDIMFAIGGTLLIFIFWSLCKVSNQYV